MDAKWTTYNSAECIFHGYVYNFVQNNCIKAKK